MCGVIIATIRDDRIAAARLYVEPVEHSEEDIDAAVEELYRPPLQDPGRSQLAPVLIKPAPLWLIEPRKSRIDWIKSAHAISQAAARPWSHSRR
jgi:hypothetical protein